MLDMRIGTVMAVLLVSLFSLSGMREASAESRLAAVWGSSTEEIEKAVAKRRGKTELSKLAASMKPGTWAELKVRGPEKDVVKEYKNWPGHTVMIPKGIFRSPKVDGGRNNGGTGGLHIAGWTDDAFWDSRTGQLFYMGLRQTRRFVAFSEEENAWRSIELDPTSDNPVMLQKFGHIYGTSGFDPVRSRFYHQYRKYKRRDLDLEAGISYYDVVAGKWTKLPKAIDGRNMSIEYFSAMDGLVILREKMVFFSQKKQAWKTLDNGESPVNGYHSLFKHNPFLNELLMAGGNQSPRTVARLTAKGKIERLKDSPVTLSIGGDQLLIDPASGRYLISNQEKKVRGRTLYEFDSRTNQYRLVKPFGEGWPFGKYGMPVCACIPEYGVSIWTEGRTFLYKHDASAEYPVVEPEPAAKKSEEK